MKPSIHLQGIKDIRIIIVLLKKTSYKYKSSFRCGHMVTRHTPSLFGLFTTQV